MQNSSFACRKFKAAIPQLFGQSKTSLHSTAGLARLGPSLTNKKQAFTSMAAKASGAAAAARRQSVGVDAIASQAFVAQWRACATTGRKSTAELPILMRCEIRCASSRNKESSDPTPCSDQANQRAQLYTIEANWHQCPSLYLPLAPCKRHAEAKQQGMREW